MFANVSSMKGPVDIHVPSSLGANDMNRDVNEVYTQYAAQSYFQVYGRSLPQTADEYKDFRKAFKQAKRLDSAHFALNETGLAEPELTPLLHNFL